jgi:hypothetical protein
MGRIARWLEILSAFDFLVEYRAGVKHGNAATMSRCYNPNDWNCPQTDNLEYLQCGPCKKCDKRAIDMASSIQGFTSLSINLDKSKTDLETAKGTNKICAVKTRQQVSYENIWTPCNGGYSTPELQTLQRDDTDIGPIFPWKENGSRPTIKELGNKNPATRHY